MARASGDAGEKQHTVGARVAMTSESPEMSLLRRPDYLARILLVALVVVLVYGTVPLALLRIPRLVLPLLQRLVPSPDTSRMLEWLGLVFVPLAGPAFLGAVIMGSRRLWGKTPRRRQERELIRSGWLGLSVAQVLATPMGAIYYGTLGLPLRLWEVILASLLGLLGGGVSLCLVRILVILAGDRRYLGSLLAMPLLAGLMLPALLRSAVPLLHRLSFWTPYYHSTLLMETRAHWMPGRTLLSLSILIVFAALGRSLALSLAERTP